MDNALRTEILQIVNNQPRHTVQGNANLTPQLIDHEGWRVEVVTTYGETRRFYVGKSTGWQPCHLEIKRRDSLGGVSAEREYASIKRLYQR